MEHLIWRGLGKMASFLLPLLYFALAWRIGYGQQITDGKVYVKKSLAFVQLVSGAFW